jgi:hypothetical protein
VTKSSLASGWPDVSVKKSPQTNFWSNLIHDVCFGKKQNKNVGYFCNFLKLPKVCKQSPSHPDWHAHYF